MKIENAKIVLDHDERIVMGGDFDALNYKVLYKGEEVKYAIAVIIKNR